MNMGKAPAAHLLQTDSLQHKCVVDDGAHNKVVVAVNVDSASVNSSLPQIGGSR
jgi:hypothetical protein